MTRMSWRRSFITTSAARSRRSSLLPCAIADKVPLVQGHTTIARGSSDDLLERAADVVMKERRQLILVVREMPLSVIHLENMLKLARMGVTIMPAAPGFYHEPRRIEDLVDFVVARIMDHLDIPQDLIPPWG